jgi:hypothetical protein
LKTVAWGHSRNLHEGIGAKEVSFPQEKCRR